ncbi:phosphoinositide-3-kinase-interacting protein 1 precursor [Silurus asotus]|uniref:Phosphoinositide-3-kinase-interacting protein 1 n=1 Tax=Silurus asotus TaxID=30991 RepID=A0AAD5ACC9_SILAS|nr:phosphoinositide-3-kinase-interacting protein 1 precursor [Silurus asotus]
MARPVHLVFLLCMALEHASALFEECTRGNGVQYRGEQNKSSSGSFCLNWNNTTRDYDVTLHPQLATVVGDHNYCRNPDDSGEPWCYVSGADGQLLREACSIEACQDKNCTGAVTCVMSLSEEEMTTELVRSVEGAPVQPVVGVSQRVRTGPKKKKDLGVMGYVLAIIMMSIIIILGVGITLGYFYKRGRDLKKQHDQHVYEREMHRITLPLSAFANPTCELVDENTIVVTAEPSDQAPSQAVVEVSDPLIDSVGTPGA